MKAIQLHGFEGTRSLKLVDIDKPTPKPMEVLIEVKAAGINYADAEQARGRYPTFGKPSFVLGFEAAGIVREKGEEVAGVRPGDLLTAVVSSGGYAEFALAPGNAVIPIPRNLSFNEATTIIALASSEDKLALLVSLGADVTINYMKLHEAEWSDKVRQATNGRESMPCCRCQRERRRRELDIEPDEHLIFPSEAARGASLGSHDQGGTG